MEWKIKCKLKSEVVREGVEGFRRLGLKTPLPHELAGFGSGFRGSWEVDSNSVLFWGSSVQKNSLRRRIRFKLRAQGLG